MRDRPNDATGKVVYLKPAHARAARLRALQEDLAYGGRRVGQSVGPALTFVLRAGWQLVRVLICAVLVLLEPVVRIVLVPFAFLAFLVTLVFGFLMGAPNFPKWGMLAFSVGALVLYWLYLGVMGLFMRLPR